VGSELPNVKSSIESIGLAQFLVLSTGVFDLIVNAERETRSNMISSDLVSSLPLLVIFSFE
jgi:hypothetical protein